MREIRSWITLATCLALSACGLVETPSGDDRPTSRRQAITGGERELGYPEVVGLSSPSGDCTGTVIGPYAVLTAKHCVFEPAAGGGWQEKPLGSMRVVMTDDLDAGGPSVGVREVWTTPGVDVDRDIYQTGSDIAVLIVAEVLPMPPRAVGQVDPPPGELETIVGFGMTDPANPASAGPKMRGTVTVDRIGISILVSAAPSIPLPGDSGGPLIDAAGRVVGVAAYGGGDSAGYTRISAFGPLMERAVAFEPCLPVAEICDGRDDDCDGVIDDGAGCSAEGEPCQTVADCADGNCELVGEVRLCVAAADACGLQVAARVTELGTLSPDAVALDLAGKAVAASDDGTRVLVGAESADTVWGENAGEARVWLRVGAGWQEEARLIPSAGAANDSFGGSVALSADGTRALVGARRGPTDAGPDTGAAFVFVRHGELWSEEAALSPEVGQDTAKFGMSLSLSADGSRALVGAPYFATDAGRVGSATLFVRDENGWRRDATLLDPAGEARDEFGINVALSGDGQRAVVGSSNYNGGAPAYVGMVKVYARGGEAWAEEATLLSPAPLEYRPFGYRVAISGAGDRLLIGDGLARIGLGPVSGIAWVFARSGTVWHEEARLVSSRPRFDGFSMAVALARDGHRALVGSPNDSRQAISNGAATVFTRNGESWSEEAVLIAPEREDNQYLGTSVALSGDGAVAVAGANGDRVQPGIASGSARVFEVMSATGAACAGPGTCQSGQCVDGVCCACDCGGGADDCQACSVAAGGQVDGLCTPLTPEAADATLCRPAEGPCGQEERCAPDARECPADAHIPAEAATPCRVASCEAGQAVAAATCDGTSPGCPAEARSACGAYLCALDVCGVSCLDDTHCAEGYVCLDQLCVPPSPPDAAPDAAMVVTPDAAMVVTPDAAMVVTPDAATVATPDAATVATPDAATVATPDAATVATPDAATVVTPDAATVVMPDAATVATADATPDAATVATADATPDAAPEARSITRRDTGCSQTNPRGSRWGVLVAGLLLVAAARRRRGWRDTEAS